MQMGGYSDGCTLSGKGQNSVLLQKITTATSLGSSVLPDRGRDSELYYVLNAPTTAVGILGSPVARVDETS